MANAPRKKPSAATPRAATPRVGALLAFDALRTWAIPAVAGAVFVVAAGLSATEIVPTGPAVATGILAVFVLLLWIGLRPLLDDGATTRERLIGVAVAVPWLVLLYLPFHARIFPGQPLLAPLEIPVGSKLLPVHIPAAGHAAVDLLLEGKLMHAATGAAIPVGYTLTITDGTTPQAVVGRFDEQLKTQRLGRRGTAVVHQAHVADVRELTNPARSDLSITAVATDPADAPPITVTAYPHRLPGPLVSGLVAAALLAAALWADRLPSLRSTDGTFTYATAAVIGAIVVFATGNVLHPDFRSLIGSAIFGGPVGFGVGALVWWIAKRIAPLER